MNINIGKKLFTNYEDADRAAKAMRARHNEPFEPIKAENGWVVGGKYLKNKTPYRRAKSLSEIHSLFKELATQVSENDVTEYATQVTTTTGPSEAKGENEGWTLLSSERLTGRQLGMQNDNIYLVLNLASEEKRLRIQMGGAFSPHIPLVAIQAHSLIGRTIIWHTWNSTKDPKKWEEKKWFYMIEPAPALTPET